MTAARHAMTRHHPFKSTKNVDAELRHGMAKRPPNNSPGATLMPTGEKTICVYCIVAEGNGGGGGGAEQ